MMKRAIVFIIIFIISIVPYPAVLRAELLDRVVAYVDNRAITRSEFLDVYDKSQGKRGKIAEEEVLNGMINRYLLLKDARRLRLDAATEDELLEQYIELRIRSMIIVSEKDSRKFYDDNRLQFKGKEFGEVRDDIENYLFEKETNILLKRQVEQLREQSIIVIQLTAGS